MYSWSWGDPRGLREQAWTEPANVPGAKQRRVFDNQESKQTLVAWSTTTKKKHISTHGHMGIANIVPKVLACFGTSNAMFLI